MASKHGLGRGLGALLSPSEPAPLAAAAMIGGGIQDISVGDIVPNPQQPRKDFEINALSELAASLRQSGVIQPVVVRRAGQGYQLIVGERRWRAANLAGPAEVPAVIRGAAGARSRGV